jgi:hypothetical protein
LGISVLPVNLYVTPLYWGMKDLQDAILKPSREDAEKFKKIVKDDTIQTSWLRWTHRVRIGPQSKGANPSSLVS